VDLVLGPGVCICTACVAAIGDAAAGEHGDTCSFCRRKERASRFRFLKRAILATGGEGNVRICSGCVAIARNVLRLRASDPDQYRPAEDVESGD
jgi:hypothetical protein